MPAQENPDQAGFAGARGADNGGLASGLKSKVDSFEYYAPRCAHAHPLECDGNSSRRFAAGDYGSAHGLPGLLLFGFIAGPERFEEAEGDIALGWVLAGDERDLLSEDRQVQRPVDKQQHTASLASARKVIEQ